MWHGDCLLVLEVFTVPTTSGPRRGSRGSRRNLTPSGSLGGEQRRLAFRRRTFPRHLLRSDITYLSLTLVFRAANRMAGLAYLSKRGWAGKLSLSSMGLVKLIQERYLPPCFVVHHTGRFEPIWQGEGYQTHRLAEFASYTVCGAI